MKYRRWLPFALAALVLAAPSGAEKVQELPVEGMAAFAAKQFAGQPVVITHLDTKPPEGGWPSDKDLKALPLLDRLQKLCSRYPPEDDSPALIPFRVRGAWTIAAETRQEPVADLSAVSLSEVIPGEVALQAAFSALDEKEMAVLGSENGTAIAALNADSAGLFAIALKPPLQIGRTQITNEPLEYPELVPMERILKPLDPRNVRVRARLRVSWISWGNEESPDETPLPELAERLVMEQEEVEIADTERTGPRTLEEQPNSFKPSDLDGRQMPRVFNKTGLMTIGDVLKQASLVTGLKLVGPPEVLKVPVFVGSAGLTCGDVLDSVRLALTGAWRRVGTQYVLCWDRRGLAALQTAATEATRPLMEQMVRLTEPPQYRTELYLAVKHLPFSETDPLRLTQTQRRNLFRPVGDEEPEPSLRWNEMTNRQQNTIRSAFLGREVPVTVQGDVISRTVDESILRSSRIMPNLHVELEFQLPGRPWVAWSGSWEGWISYYDWAVGRAKELGIEDDMPPDDFDVIPDEFVEAAKDPQPDAIPAQMRGVIVPPLTSSRLAVVLKEMKNRNLSVLFYPLLFNGHAAIPTAVFPLQPGADTNSWADIVSAAKAKGIRVVGYINTLSWHTENKRGHWMERHSEWEDVDPLGRTGLQWLKAHPPATGLLPYLDIPAGSPVRPAEPAVVSKLTTLVADSAKLDGATGIAFLDWHTDSSHMGLSILPLYGFALPERLKSIAAKGVDLLDIGIESGILVSELRRGPLTSWDRSFPERGGAYVDLLETLVKTAKTARKDWKVYASVPPDSDLAGVKVRPDVWLEQALGGSNQGRNVGSVLSVGAMNPLEAIANSGEPEVSTFIGQLPEFLFSVPSIPLCHILMKLDGEITGPPYASPIGLYDFRLSPDLILPSMKWIAREPVPAKPKPPRDTPRPATENAIEQP